MPRKRSDNRGPAPRAKRQARAAAPTLPTKDEILEFIATSTGKVGKREIARAFSVKGPDRIELKRRIAELAADGRIAGDRKRLRQAGMLPSTAVLEVTGTDADGDLLARPVVRGEDDAGPPPVIRVLQPSGGGGDTALGPGDRVLARLTRIDDLDEDGDPLGPPRYEAIPIKRLPREMRRQLGIFRSHARGGGSIDPVDRKDLKTWSIAPGDDGAAADGDLVRYELLRAGRLGVPKARVAEVLGNPRDERKVSLIAVHAHGIPEDFSARAMAELARLPRLGMDGRTDLRRLPLLTIDPFDARDHDDAVHAAADTDPANPGGHVVTVAIADVAFYVRPGSALDRDAEVRGNSVYFPDRVVPMLPERISNDLCSLREHEDRPCLAVRMVFDRSGTKRSHRFQRAMMRSAAKLSYEEAQAAIGGRPSDRAEPLMETALKPLWAAYEALAAGRARREPLELDLPERKILLDAHGHVERVVVPERLEAHKLIEEFMIQANVAAAEELERKKAPVVFRVHGEPAKEKVLALREFLDSLDIKLPGTEQLKPGHFNRVLARARQLPVAELVSEVVLRSQAQAEYAPENYGHFGLNLRRYAHFTSPIRRYADLLVHRSLIRALGLGEDGLPDGAAGRLKDVCASISQAERRAMAAERETTDRLISAYLADRVGAVFAGRISGVTKSGLFVRLSDTGADGFVPAATIGQDYYRYEEALHALVGDRTGESYQLGDPVEVKLVEAIPTAGALRFEMVTPGRRGHIPHARGRRSRGRGPGRRR